MLNFPQTGQSLSVIDIMDFQMASILPGFLTEFSFAMLEDQSIVMHATINAGEHQVEEERSDNQFYFYKIAEIDS